MINDDTLYELGRVSTDDFGTLKASFNDLPADQYAAKGLRSRRYSRYRLREGGELEHLPQKDFMQSSEINKAVGDVERHFEEIDPKLEKDPAFRRLFQAFAETAGLAPGNMIEAHQIRWHCDQDVAIPAPEGTHQDGFDRIAMFQIDRANVEGGNVLVYGGPGGPLLLKKNLEVGEFAVLNDKKVFHNASPLIPEANPQPGHWDMIVLTANKA